MTDLFPELRLLLPIGFEQDGPVQEGKSLVDLVATDGKVRRPP